jgi:hypothetical protein
VRFIKVGVSLEYGALEDGTIKNVVREEGAQRAGVLEGVSQRNAGSQAVNVPENILENVESRAAVLEDTVEEVGTHVVVTRNY